jgi:hypothetical protein
MDTRDERVLEKWGKYLSSGEDNASASCDFAELIWSDAVTQAQQIELLKTGDANIRRAVAWAICDLSRDNKAMRYLMNECFCDGDAVSRRYVWGAVSQSQCLSFDQKQPLVDKLGEERDEVVLQFVRDVRLASQS